jgi:hypothetical protein
LARFAESDGRAISRLVRRVGTAGRSPAVWPGAAPLDRSIVRFWTFQFIEGGWPVHRGRLALSLLLLAATVWLVRRCAA